MGTRSTRCSLRLVLIPAAGISLFASALWGQDAPSLGDLARQQRQQKQQSRTAPSNDLNPPGVITNRVITNRVITNEEIPERPESPSPPAASGEQNRSLPAAPANAAKLPAEYWKSQILAQKNRIASLQSQLDAISESIRFAPANCAANCAAWNERQRAKQQRGEGMREQLAEQKTRLEDMRESARRQGYGSSVYDP